MNVERDIDSLIQSFDGIEDLKSTIGSDEYKGTITNLVLKLEGIIRNTDSDPDTLFSLLSDRRPDEVFWNHIRKLLCKRMEAFNDTSFLRQMTAEERVALLQTSFQNMILFQEPANYLKKIMSVTDEQLTVIFRVYSTLIDWVLIERYSKRYFIDRCEHVFSFDNVQSEALWKTLYDNKQMLLERKLTRSFKELDAYMRRLDKFFQELDEISDGEEETH